MMVGSSFKSKQRSCSQLCRIQEKTRGSHGLFLTFRKISISRENLVNANNEWSRSILSSMSKYYAGNSQHLSFPFFLVQITYHILCTYFCSYFLGAPREYVLHDLALGLDWTSCQLSSTCIFLDCLGPPSILLFVPTIHVSHVDTPLTTRRLNTSTQENNMAMLHLIYNRHTYTVYIT
jgi:hypothetical protein